MQPNWRHSSAVSLTFLSSSPSALQDQHLQLPFRPTAPFLAKAEIIKADLVVLRILIPKLPDVIPLGHLLKIHISRLHPWRV